MNDALSILLDGTTRTVLTGAALLGALAGALGTFAVLRRQSLLGDVLAHAALPGIVVAFLLTGERALPVLAVGALASGLLWSALLQLLARRTRLRADGATTLVLSISFALGLALLSAAQSRGDAASAGLQSFLFGQAAALLPGDVAVLAAVTLVLAAAVALAWPALVLVTFDPGYARSVGVPVAAVEAFVTGALAVAVVLGLQLVGVVLVTALVVAPAVAARPWTRRLAPLVGTAAALGAAAGATGATVSAFDRDAATGPVVVVVATVIAIASVGVRVARERGRARGRGRAPDVLGGRP